LGPYPDWLLATLGQAINAELRFFTEKRYIRITQTLYNIIDSRTMHIFKIAIIPALALISFGYHNRLTFQENAKSVEKRIAKVNDTLYIGKTEISNAEYNRFLADQPRESWLKRDSTKWTNIPSGDSLVKYYGNHNSYSNYPVVTITHEAAREYCKWLTESYMADPKRKFKKVKFDLPSHAEWLMAAHADKPKYIYPWGDNIWRKTGESMAMFRPIGDHRIAFDSSTQKYVVVISQAEIDEWYTYPLPAPVRAFWPNSLGIYQQCGNVAEMVFEKGIAAGGSFMDPGYDVRIASIKHYDKPSAMIGFRIAMYIQK
jgi:hypothetical protein